MVIHLFLWCLKGTYSKPCYWVLLNLLTYCSLFIDSGMIFLRASRMMRCCAPSEILEELTLESSCLMQIPKRSIEKHIKATKNHDFWAIFYSLPLELMLYTSQAWRMPRLRRPRRPRLRRPRLRRSKALRHKGRTAVLSGWDDGMYLYLLVWLECLVCWSRRLKMTIYWDVHGYLATR